MRLGFPVVDRIENEMVQERVGENAKPGEKEKVGEKLGG